MEANSLLTVGGADTVERIGPEAFNFVVDEDPDLPQQDSSSLRFAEVVSHMGQYSSETSQNNKALSTNRRSFSNQIFINDHLASIFEISPPVVSLGMAHSMFKLQLLLLVLNYYSLLSISLHR